MSDLRGTGRHPALNSRSSATLHGAPNSLTLDELVDDKTSPSIRIRMTRRRFAKFKQPQSRRYGYMTWSLA